MPIQNEFFPALVSVVAKAGCALVLAILAVAGIAALVALALR